MTKPLRLPPHLPSSISLSEVNPMIHDLEISDLSLKSLADLPHQMPHLIHIDASGNSLTSLHGFPDVSSINPSSPIFLTINVCGNALTSLYGLPPVIRTSAKEDIVIDVQENCLENLAGLPELYIPGDSHGEYQIPILHLEGNPLRSLHGLSRRVLFSFTVGCSPFCNPSNLPEHLPTHSPVGVYFLEEEFPGENFRRETFFELSLLGAHLLEACFNENVDYFVSPHMSNAFFEIGFNEAIDSPPQSWVAAYDALFEYYHLSPLELAHQYITCRNSGSLMSEMAISRLAYEGGPIERHLLENNVPFDDLLLKSIQNRLSVNLDDGHHLFL